VALRSDRNAKRICKEERKMLKEAMKMGGDNEHELA
jgi:hypothetical protein